MSTLHRILALSALACGFSFSTGAVAQGTACPSGSSPAIMRISKLNPGITMNSVHETVALHQKWYSDHGYASDRILFEPVMLYDPATSKVMVATDQFITLHLGVHEVPAAQHDTAWNAFVAAYTTDATISSTTLTCMP